MTLPRPHRPVTTQFALVVTLAALAIVAVACSSSAPTPTPTPPYGLPPLVLPIDEESHDFQTEWWYFNVRLADESGNQYSLHDVVFQVQELRSSRTLYVRQIGLADVKGGTHAQAERFRNADEPLASEPDSFRIEIGNSLMSGVGGREYRLVGRAGDISYDLTLSASADPLLHDDDGLVDFEPAGITYYYSRPRLDTSGTITTADGHTLPVTGLGWLDKQWGNFQPVLLGWDWTSIQLDDGTDIMLSRLFDRQRNELDLYGTLRRPGGEVRRLGATDFDFTPLDDSWTSERSDTTYKTKWRIRVPDEDLDFVLSPLVAESEFVSRILGVVYWEAGVEAIDPDGRRIGQGFVELNWPRGTTP